MIKLATSVIALALSATIAGAQTAPAPVAGRPAIAVATKSTAHAALAASPRRTAVTPVKSLAARGHGVVQAMAAGTAPKLAAKPTTPSPAK